MLLAEFLLDLQTVSACSWRGRKQTTVLKDHPSAQFSAAAWGSNVAIPGGRGAEVMGRRPVVNQGARALLWPVPQTDKQQLHLETEP